ncbi:MAG: hypothetical protein JO127_19590 [Caulobacteraceae bacterium]|nr:hypothetical protein [Caulobacteraceae bacterium]
MNDATRERGQGALDAGEQEACAPETPFEGEPGSVRATILAAFRRVAVAQDRTLATLSDGLTLLESGLDSLCFAIIVAILEDELGFDPFSLSEDVYFPVTVGDFIRFYENATP